MFCRIGYSGVPANGVHVAVQASSPALCADGFGLLCCLGHGGLFPVHLREWMGTPGVDPLPHGLAD